MRDSCSIREDDLVLRVFGNRKRQITTDKAGRLIKAVAINKPIMQWCFSVSVLLYLSRRVSFYNYFALFARENE